VPTPTPNPIEQELTRRGLLVGAGAGVLGVAGLAQVIDRLTKVSEALAATLPALSPNDPVVKATMKAYIDTIVPGPAGHADTHPGAVEAGLLDEIYDPFYGASSTYSYIHNDLLVTTPRVLGRAAQFDLELPYRDRERVVLDRITATGAGGRNLEYLLYEGVAILVYVAYYGTARSTAGPRYIGFPPHSDGYWPNHSYRLRFRGMTKDGNLP
jgi:hypothetical protein